MLPRLSIYIFLGSLLLMSYCKDGMNSNEGIHDRETRYFENGQAESDLFTTSDNKWIFMRQWTRDGSLLEIRVNATDASQQFVFLCIEGRVAKRKAATLKEINGRGVVFLRILDWYKSDGQRSCISGPCEEIGPWTLPVCRMYNSLEVLPPPDGDMFRKFQESVESLRRAQP